VVEADLCDGGGEDARVLEHVQHILFNFCDLVVRLNQQKAQRD